MTDPTRLPRPDAAPHEFRPAPSPAFYRRADPVLVPSERVAGPDGDMYVFRLPQEPATPPPDVAAVVRPAHEPVSDAGAHASEASPAPKPVYVDTPPQGVYRPVGEGDARRTFVSALPPEYLDTRPPLPYRLATESERGSSAARITQSRVYRAKAFSCAFFYKPVTRCVIWEK